MATCDNRYYRGLMDIRERNKYDTVFEEALDELTDKIDFSWVKSCVSFGTGSGKLELLFARRFLPNLQRFVAVEQDHESIEAFRANIQDGQLPGVEVTAMETSIQRWSGVDKPLDAVLLFNALLTVESADRQALFQQLFRQHLAPNGIVIIVGYLGGPTCGTVCLLERLGMRSPGYYDQIEKDVLATGFSHVYTQDITGSDDLSNPSQDIVTFFQIFPNTNVSEEDVRAAIADIFGSMKCIFHSKLGIFKK